MDLTYFNNLTLMDIYLVFMIIILIIMSIYINNKYSYHLQNKTCKK